MLVDVLSSLVIVVFEDDEVEFVLVEVDELVVVFVVVVFVVF